MEKTNTAVWRTVLEDVEDLLFDLLEEVFHLDDDDLHLALVGFAAEGVDLAPHLLRNEAEFLANAGSGNALLCDRFAV